MKFKCIKTLRMPDKHFAKGREYQPITFNSDGGFCVVNHKGGPHWIHQPGDKFFDEYFVLIPVNQ